jgi:hypothetical protein
MRFQQLLNEIASIDAKHIGSRNISERRAESVARWKVVFAAHQAARSV